MPVTEPFRITPNLGPDLHQTSPYYWAEIHGQNSYQPGTKVVGNDGHEYVHVIAGASFAADAPVDINETTWVATAGDGSSEFEAPVAVENGEWFHARKQDI